ncbi:hypothetical protein MRX96_034780 [Rhipicephalus microplus]
MPTEISMAGRSSNKEVPHGYRWRPGVLQLPNAFMVFAQDKRRSTAADNTRGDTRNDVASKLKNTSSGANEKHRDNAMAALQGRGTKEMQLQRPWLL